MKHMRLKNSWFAMLCGLAFAGCEEVGPIINTGGGGSSGGGGTVDSTQLKTVLLEVFTATNCPNCPDGTEISENLEAAYPDQLEVIEIHQGILSQQLEPDDPVLKTQDGEDLAAYLGPPPYWPCGAVDRINYEVSPGNFARLNDRGLWSSFVAQQVNSPLTILLGMDLDFDEATRKLSGNVTINFLEDITVPVNVSILIKENGIVAAQLDGTTEIPDYVHNNVLRDIVTTFYGEPVGGDKLAGSSWTYQISGSYPPLPAEWNADSCTVVAFVSEAVNDYDVLQAIHKPLKP